MALEDPGNHHLLSRSKPIGHTAQDYPTQHTTSRKRKTRTPRPTRRRFQATTGHKLPHRKAHGPRTCRTTENCKETQAQTPFALRLRMTKIDGRTEDSAPPKDTSTKNIKSNGGQIKAKRTQGKSNTIGEKKKRLLLLLLPTHTKYNVKDRTLITTRPQRSVRVDMMTKANPMGHASLSPQAAVSSEGQSETSHDHKKESNKPQRLEPQGGRDKT